MAFWLLKTEPGEYSFQNLLQQGPDVWDGVKSPAAQKNIKSMQPKDLAFIYHTGKERSLTGVAEIITRPYPDPKGTGLYVIDLAPVYRLKRPVSLAEIKQDHFFSGWELVRLPRLSVIPVPPEFWDKIHRMAEYPLT